MAGEINTVPLGQAGTGAAYELGPSQAINNISNYIDSNQAQQAAAARAQQAAAADLAASWQTHQLKIKAGTLWQNEINDKTNSVMELGKQLQTAGVDPRKHYSDPNIQGIVDKYNSGFQEATQMGEIRDKYATKLGASHNLISAQPDGYFDRDSVAAVNNFPNLKLADIIKNGTPAPELSRPYNLEQDVAKLQPTTVENTHVVNGMKIHTIAPDATKHQSIASEFLQTNPQAKNFVEKQIGMPISQLPASTDAVALKKQLDDYYHSAPVVPQLAKIGITSYDDPKYSAMLDGQVNSLVNARKKYDSISGGIVQSLNDRAKTANDRTPDDSAFEAMKRRVDFSHENIKFAQGQEDRNKTDVTYNVPGTAVNPGKIGENGTKAPVTYPAVLPNIGKEMTVSPGEVYNPVTDHFGSNAGPMDVKMGSPVLMPVIEVKGPNGQMMKQHVNDSQIDQIKAGKFNINGVPVTDKDLKYRYMIGGTYKKREPIMETTIDQKTNQRVQTPTGHYTTEDKPVSFDASSVNSKLYDKDINYNTIESKLPDFVRSRVVRPGSQPKTISSQADYDNLEKGEQYIDSSGKTYIKK